MTDLLSGRFTVRLRRGEAARLVWEHLTDLERHSERIPFTTVQSDGRRMRPGMSFHATTRLGPLEVVDRMCVEAAQAPSELSGHLVVSKEGPFAGVVDARVADDGVGSVLEWTQTLHPTWLPAFLRAPATLVAWAAYAVGLRRLLG